MTVKLPDGSFEGQLEGVLFRFTDTDVRPAPIAVVEGTWAVGDLGRGRFQAGIVALEGGQPGQAIGKMAGVFSDPLRDGVRDPVGSFAARWAICP